MDKTIIGPAHVSGTVQAPPSKACSHRAIICASLAGGKSTIKNFLSSDDIAATISAMRSFGAKISAKGNSLTITGTSGKLLAPKNPINCEMSGSTIRFLIPVAALAKGKTILTGEGGLLKRPMQPVLDALAKMGIRCGSSNGFPPITIHGEGKIKGGKTSIVGNVSSQFVSGLLFALPFAQKASSLQITTGLESAPYVELTLEILKKFGAKIGASGDLRKFKIRGKQKLRPQAYAVPGDFSSAAFLLAAGAIAGEMKVSNLSMSSSQGDREIVNILRNMGANILENHKEGCIIARKSRLSAVEVDVSDIPDLVPILAALACFCEGTTRIFNARRLRLKESDRLAAITGELKRMGAAIEERADELVVHSSQLHGAEINPHGDHRIAMACAIAALGAEGKTTIKDAEVVSKSYPDFWRDLEAIAAPR